VTATARRTRARMSRRRSSRRRRPPTEASRSRRPRPVSRRDCPTAWPRRMGSSRWSVCSCTATNAKSGSSARSPRAWRGVGCPPTGRRPTKTCASTASSVLPRAKWCSRDGFAICSRRSPPTPRSCSRTSQSGSRARPSCRTLAWWTGLPVASCCASIATRPSPPSWPRASCAAGGRSTPSGRPRRRASCSNDSRSNEPSSPRKPASS